MIFRPIIALAAFSLVVSRAENWPQFRGPAGDGRSSEKNAPVIWSQSEGIRWKQAIPGEGHSSPVVWNESIFLTSTLPDGSCLLLQINAASGKINWKVPVLQAEREPMHRENSSASSTVATDGERVITSFQAGDKVDLRCFDAKTGEAKWEERLGGRFRASLLYADGRIYATNDKGKTIVFRAVPNAWEKISENDLNEFCYATPAISNGRIYVRTGKQLYRIENRAQ